MNCPGCGRNVHLLIAVHADDLPMRNLCVECVQNYTSVRMDALLGKKDAHGVELASQPDSYWISQGRAVPKWVLEAREHIAKKVAGAVKG